MFTLLFSQRDQPKVVHCQFCFGENICPSVGFLLLSMLLMLKIIILPFSWSILMVSVCLFICLFYLFMLANWTPPHLSIVTFVKRRETKRITIKCKLSNVCIWYLFDLKSLSIRSFDKKHFFLIINFIISIC